MSEKVLLEVVMESGELREFAAGGGPQSLSEVLASHDLPLNTRCGQRGLCRGCEVELREGSVLTHDGARHAPATVQACRAHPAAGATLRIPARSRIEHRA